MQGKSIRSDIERAASEVGASERRSVPMPRYKPREEENYNPNWSDEQAAQNAHALFRRGEQAGETGEGEAEVLDFIRRQGDTPYGQYMKRGYELGRSRRGTRKPVTMQEEELRERRRLVRRQGQYGSPFKVER